MDHQIIYKLKIIKTTNGGDKEARTPDPLRARQVLSQLSYIPTMAERVGFEPTVPLSITGFQDQLLKPLGHLSMSDTC